MSATVHYQQSLDVICQHKPDGSIVPLKLRLRDPDGENQAYIVKSYRCCGLTDAIKNPTYSRVMFECKINSFGRGTIHICKKEFALFANSFNKCIYKVR